MKIELYPDRRYALVPPMRVNYCLEAAASWVTSEQQARGTGAPIARRLVMLEMALNYLDQANGETKPFEVSL